MTRGKKLQWLARCNPLNSPERAYTVIREQNEAEWRGLFSFSDAWTGERCNADSVKRALFLMPPVKLERRVLARLQGLHLPWIRDDEWRYFMIFVLEMEGRKAGSVVLPNADPRHPGYNGTSQRIAPNPVIVECRGLGGGDLTLAQPWHVCIRTNKHKQQVYAPSLALVEECVRLTDQSTVYVTGVGLTKSLHKFLALQYYATDSAACWYELLRGWFPHVQWTVPGRLRYSVRDIYKVYTLHPRIVACHTHVGLDL